ncbi:MAG TPA: sigma-54 dependent transcriptional regulator [Gemmatimonadota bacterium]|nr:sigma-54 dependent transcriptional regulator [Gemmatimonadota bacterium]
MKDGRLLVVDDDDAHRKTLAGYLTRQGYRVTAADSAEQALMLLAEADPEVILSDIRMPGLSGIELLEKLMESEHPADVILITAFEDMQTAVEAMRIGAYDYLVKPLDLDRIDAALERCFWERRSQQEARAEEEPPALDLRNLMVGSDPKMIEIYKLIGKLAAVRTPVLIRGETGTGKERIARAIHAHSANSDDPFMAVNCTALPDTLLESELFGHVRGAFTGAVGDRKGRFELAGKGTILLDEIGDVSAAFQSKLLRVLQEREFQPVGAEQPRRTEARVIAATHRNMEELVEEGDFREDLYFRLRVMEIVVPPLRERRGDIPDLAHHILRQVTTEMGKGELAIPDPVMDKLVTYDWPGNVRELENALTRAAVHAQGAIAEENLFLGATETAPTAAPDLSDPAQASLESMERYHIQRVLAKTGGHKANAAKMLGISRPRLNRLIDKYDITVPG